MRRLEAIGARLGGDRADDCGRPRNISHRLARLRESLVDLSLDPARAPSTRNRIAEFAVFLAGIFDDAAALEAALARATGTQQARPERRESDRRSGRILPQAVCEDLRPRVSVDATVELRMATMAQEREARLEREADRRRERATIAEDFQALMADQ